PRDLPSFLGFVAAALSPRDSHSSLCCPAAFGTGLLPRFGASYTSEHGLEPRCRFRTAALPVEATLYRRYGMNRRRARHQRLVVPRFSRRFVSARADFRPLARFPVLPCGNPPGARAG